MTTSAKTSAKPAEAKDTARPDGWNVFDWYENKMEEGLQTLHRVDNASRQVICEIIHEMHDSDMYWKLFSKFQAASDAAGEQGRDEVLTAMFARMYIAGTLRGARLVDL